MRKTLKRILPIILAMAVLLSCSAATYAQTGAYPGGGNVVAAQEEIVNLLSNGAEYSFTTSDKLTSGTYALETTIGFKGADVSYVPSFMEIKGTNASDEEKMIAGLMIGGDSSLRIKYRNSTSATGDTTTPTGIVLTKYTKYNFKIVFSLDSREFFVFLDGVQLLPTTKMYVSELANVTTALYAQTASGSQFSVENTVLKKSIIDPAWRITSILEENFENFENTKSKYADVTTNVPVIKSDVLVKDGSVSKVWHANKTSSRLLTADANAYNSHVKGVIETSIDFKFNDALPTGDFEVLRAQDNGRMNNVYLVYANGDKLYLKDHSEFLQWDTANGYTYGDGDYGSAQIATIEKDTWYTVKVCYDTYSKRLCVYLNDVLCNPDKAYFIKNLNTLGTVIRLQHTTDYANADAYFDNFKCISKERTENDGLTVIERVKFNEGLNSYTGDNFKRGVVQLEKTAGTPTISNGILEINGATDDNVVATMAGNTPLKNGSYRVNFDVKFERLNTVKDHNSLIAATIKNGDAKLFEFSQMNDNLYAFVRTDYNSDATRKYARLIDKIDPNKWYKIGYSIDFTTRRVRFYVDDEEVCGDVVMYAICDANLEIGRPVQFISKGAYDGKILVDNFVLGTYSLDGEIALEGGIVKESITLPATTASGKAITWSSSNEAVLSSAGVVNAAGLVNEEYVTLTAKVPVSGLSKEYTFIVRPDANIVNAVYGDGVAAAEAKLYKLSGDTIPNAKVIVAVYDNTNTLQLVKMANTAEYNSGKNFYKGGLSVSVDASNLDAGDYTVKGFVFDGFSNLVPQAVNGESTFTK